MSKNKLRYLRTYRKEVRGKDVVLPMVKFDHSEFENVNKWFRSLVINTEIPKTKKKKKSKKKGPSYTMVHKDVETVFALGGIHGCTKSGIYEAGNGKIILSADVVSYYPNLAIKNRWSPAHLPQESFCNLYEGFFIDRKKYPKGSSLNYLYKIILNATYGLSKNEYSFLYDPEFTFKITVNGQLQLAMLYEMLSTRIPGSQPLMQNTDGLEFIIDEQHRELFYQICKEWEALTKLELETVEYQKMIIGDVNNYIAVYKDVSTKCKGRFEFENLPLHKNKSMLIIPKAWYAYFINGIKPENFLAKNRNIYDYCGGVKVKGDWKIEERKVVKRSYEINPLKKIVRYYVSESGGKLVKVNTKDNREIQVESGPHTQTVFNKYIDKPWDDYTVDERFYLKKIYSEINKIEELKLKTKKQQLTLF